MFFNSLVKRLLLILLLRADVLQHGDEAGLAHQARHALLLRAVRLPAVPARHQHEVSLRSYQVIILSCLIPAKLNLVKLAEDGTLERKQLQVVSFVDGHLLQH